jgi:hypothetical protein
MGHDSSAFQGGLMIELWVLAVLVAVVVWLIKPWTWNG